MDTIVTTSRNYVLSVAKYLAYRNALKAFLSCPPLPTYNLLELKKLKVPDMTNK